MHELARTYFQDLDKVSEDTGLGDSLIGIFLDLRRNCLRFIKDLLSLVVSKCLADFS